MSGQLSYKYMPLKKGGELIAVFIDGKRIGSIIEKKIQDGLVWKSKFQYFPKGSKEGGDMFQSLSLCKLSLENEDVIVLRIKEKLMQEEEAGSWKEFIDAQRLGDCQSIVETIAHFFPVLAKPVFGEIKADELYADVNGKEQNLFIHHWVEINGLKYDFSKGSLKNHIEWNNLYNPDVEPHDEWRYYPSLSVSCNPNIEAGR